MTLEEKVAEAISNHDPELLREVSEGPYEYRGDLFKKPGYLLSPLFRFDDHFIKLLELSNKFNVMVKHDEFYECWLEFKD